MSDTASILCPACKAILIPSGRLWRCMNCGRETPMDAAALLIFDLTQAGVSLTAKGDQLVFHAPPDRPLTQAQAVELMRLRPRIIPLLQALRTPANELAAWLNTIGNADRRADLRQRWEERAAILEYDCRMSRPEAEAMALADLRKAMEGAK